MTLPSDADARLLALLSVFAPARGAAWLSRLQDPGTIRDAAALAARAPRSVRLAALGTVVEADARRLIEASALGKVLERERPRTRAALRRCLREHPATSRGPAAALLRLLREQVG